VCDLAAAVGQSESGVSHALRLLRAHRVVQVRRSGRMAYYRLADGHVRLLLDTERPSPPASSNKQATTLSSSTTTGPERPTPVFRYAHEPRLPLSDAVGAGRRSRRNPASEAKTGHGRSTALRRSPMTSSPSSGPSTVDPDDAPSSCSTSNPAPSSSTWRAAPASASPSSRQQPGRADESSASTPAHPCSPAPAAGHNERAGTMSYSSKPTASTPPTRYVQPTLIS